MKMEENFANMEEHFTCMENGSKNHVRACVFRVIGYTLSGQMKRAQNSDSKTHVKKVKSDFQNRNKTNITLGHFLKHPVLEEKLH